MPLRWWPQARIGSPPRLLDLDDVGAELAEIGRHQGRGGQRRQRPGHGCRRASVCYRRPTPAPGGQAEVLAQRRTLVAGRGTGRAVAARAPPAARRPRTRPASAWRPARSRRRRRSSNQSGIWSAICVAGTDEARALQQGGAVGGEVAQRSLSPPRWSRRSCTRPRMPDTEAISSSVSASSRRVGRSRDSSAPRVASATPADAPGR